MESLNKNKTTTKELVIHKDNITSIPYIIICLIGVLKIHPTNAEQIVTIMSYKDKCTILTAPEEILRSKHASLTKLGIYTTIQ